MMYKHRHTHAYKATVEQRFWTLFRNRPSDGSLVFLCVLFQAPWILFNHRSWENKTLSLKYPAMLAGCRWGFCLRMTTMSGKEDHISDAQAGSEEREGS